MHEQGVDRDERAVGKKRGGRGQRISLAVTVACLAMPLLGASQKSCCNKQSLKAWSKIADATWRSAGNSVLVLHPAQGASATQTIDLSATNYPFDRNSDKAFINGPRLAAILGAGSPSAINLAKADLRCGFTTTGDGNTETAEPRTTYLVLWSGDWWDGDKLELSCGGGTPPEGYELSHALGGFSVRSLCVVYQGEPGGRVARCRTGPRCDDGFKAGNETDVDCGGPQCGACSDGKHCARDADCTSKVCGSDGKCQAPTCNDHVKNGAETDVDCGGWSKSSGNWVNVSGCAACTAKGMDCDHNRDCESGQCWKQQCGGCCAVTTPKTCSGADAAGSAKLWTVLVASSLTGCGGARLYYANDRDEAKGCATAEGLTTISKLCSFLLTDPNDTFHPGVEAESSAEAKRCGKTTLCGNCTYSAAQQGQCVIQ